jgi:UDP-N-acetylglucosamine--N-acetylmuramyl-(pentapeptide) pyrophosphoryl-undecaprenol N-acetylglucosamine transferase
MNTSTLSPAASGTQKTLLVMAGGTGGHIFPAIAVAETLRNQGWRIVWLGNPEGMEGRLVPQHGFELAPVSFTAVRGKGLLRKLQLPLNLWRAIKQAGEAIATIRPNVVLGMGGYVTAPGGIAAWLKGIPLLIHEQNSVAGMANRLLAKLATRIVSGFPDVLPGGTWLGNPIRPQIAQQPAPAERFAGREDRLRLLVIGGSLGAQALNEIIPQGLALIPETERPQVIHQAGEKHLALLKANYEAAGVKADCRAFIDDMAAAYGWADLVICRAGALTVAEVAAVGVAAIFVPFPFAVDDHQTGNARLLANAGGAFLVPQPELTPESVALIQNYKRGQLLQMAEKARELAKPEATAAVAAVCAEIAK